MAISIESATSPFAELLALRDSIYLLVAPFWIEVCFIICFVLGFAVLRFDDFFSFRKSVKGEKKKKVVDDHHFHPIANPRLQQVVDKKADSKTILGVWHAAKAKVPTSPQLLRVVVQAMIEEQSKSLITDLMRHIRAHPGAMANSRTAVVALDVLARAGRIDSMTQFLRELREEFGVHPSSSMFEVMLGGYATAGDEAMVSKVMQDMKKSRAALTPRGLSLCIKGFLKNGKVDAVVKKFREMKDFGFQIPPFAVTQLVRIACEAARGREVFEAISTVATLSPEATSQLLEDCVKSNDLLLAKRIEETARSQEVVLTTGAYDALLKLHTMSADPRAMDLFEEMQASSAARISEGLCVGLLARCAEVKFLKFAEEIVKYCRGSGAMTISTYSALMKVYAYCNMYDKACDLYDQICQDGLKPDAVMYGCLMKFAVECGRTQLSQHLSESAPTLDIQNYMSLIRAAGRDKDVKRAFEILERLRSSGVHIDVAAFNCVLDVCVSAGDIKRAQNLMTEMKTLKLVDVITYNTLLKGYCQQGELAKGKALLLEMKRSGHPPNDVSYNCLINAAVCSGDGDLSLAWETIEMMEKSGVEVDHYTISIMMKALKKARDSSDVARAMALLDKSGIEVLSDEILLNTVLETCTRHRETQRLEAILTSYSNSSLQCSVHTYGALIKAASTLKKLSLCWSLWREMEEDRALEPNEIVLGCMLDALVTNRQIESAVQLLGKWKQRLPANMVMYSTIMKGFANTHQADRALKMWKEMLAEKIRLNIVVYNAVIDAQARVGAMENVSEIVSQMEQDGVKPDVISLSTIVKGYCIKGDVEAAFRVFREMQNNGMVKDSIVYNTLLDGCTRNNRFDMADSLLEDMEANHIRPTNFTMGILVKMWGRRRQLDKAFEALATLPTKHGFVPNTQVKTCLISACINNGAVEEAFEVLDSIKKAGYGVEAKVYSAMVNGLVRQGELDKAVALLVEAHGLRGGRPQLAPGGWIEADAIEKLAHGLAQRGLGEKVGVPLLDQLRAAKVPISSRAYTSVLGPCRSSQNGDRYENGVGKGNGNDGSERRDSEARNNGRRSSRPFRSS
mmetsp:Transcript_78572/g.163244  ORF Transcript_78572/g.163244 Transcript_78572/m.163244 type:complete len:1079 (+) Transcript_78572:191-3427(+)